MLIIHSDTDILVALNEDDESLAGEHIRNGYPELLDDWTAGRIRATELDKFVPMKCVIMDGGKPRRMTEDEAKARDVALAAQAAENAAAAQLEVKLQAEIREIALKSLEQKTSFLS